VGVAWIELFRNPQRMKEMSDKARNLVEGSRGATERALAEVSKYLGRVAAQVEPGHKLAGAVT
jgi:hypothetical protein